MEPLKDVVLNDVVDALILALENGVIKEGDITPIADYVLGRMDDIKSEIEMDQFLSELSTKWPIFSHITSGFQAENKEKADSEVAEGVLTLAQHGKIDEAISLAKTATQTQ